MKEAIAYLRVSTDKQDQKNQLHEISSFAKERKLKLQIIEDKISGRVDWKDRELATALEEAKKKGCMIIISEISRIARSTLQVLEFLKECAAAGVTVHLIKQGMTIDKSMQSKVLVTLFSLFSELERDLISMRTKEALAKRKKDGVILGRPEGASPKQAKLATRKDEIQKYLNMNLSVTAIAKLLNVSRGTFYKYATEAGLIKRSVQIKRKTNG